ncbi:hypothetical protein [Clostridium sp. JNZ J1-5]
MNDDDKERLSQIGAIMDSIGITTVELAEKLKEHVVGCPGGRGCIEKLMNEGEK